MPRKKKISLKDINSAIAAMPENALQEVLNSVNNNALTEKTYHIPTGTIVNWWYEMKLSRMDEYISAKEIKEYQQRMKNKENQEEEEILPPYTPRFIDIEVARKFIEKAVLHYTENNAPGWFIDEWLEGLYIRLGEDRTNVSVQELIVLSTLYDTRDESRHWDWMPTPLAVNTIYHMYDAFGWHTDGKCDH